MDTKSKEIFVSKLKDGGYSLTKTRLAIFELLMSHQPQSIAELLKAGNGLFDRVTLYRTVELFEKLDIAQRVNMGWKYKIELTDSFADHHHHLSCLKCHKLIAINEDDQLEDMIKSLAFSNGYKLVNHQLEVQGYCPACQK